MHDLNKVCSVCGRELPITSFRQYPGTKKSTTRPYCKECESIEVRRRYLVDKQAAQRISDDEVNELAKINALYKKHKEAGRTVLGQARRGKDNRIEALVDSLLCD